MGSLTFLSPMLLIGTLLAALPVAVHLLMRPRPRRVRFPTLALLRPALLSGRRAGRLRHIWLLLLRGLLLASAAVFLAGPTCRAVGGHLQGDSPLACVLVIDDSLSTHYQLPGQLSLAEQLRDEALRFVRQSGNWPAGSTVGLVFVADQRESMTPSADREHLLGLLGGGGAEHAHARGLGPALRTAAEMLHDVPQPRKAIIVFTDGAAHAWRDVSPVTSDAVDDLTLELITPQLATHTNIGISDAATIPVAPVAGAIVPLRVTVAAVGVASECAVSVSVDAAAPVSAKPVRVAAGGFRDVEFQLPPMESGRHSVTVTIAPGDHLSFDQSRYLALSTRPRPVVWLIDPPHATRDAGSLILRNLVAPSALDSTRQVVDLKQYALEELPAVPETRPALMLVFPGDGSDGRIVEQVQRGCSAILVPRGEVGESPVWAGLWKHFSALPPLNIAAPDDDWIRPEPGSPLDRDELSREFAGVTVRRQVVIAQPHADVAVHARFASGQPALISRRLGDGLLIALLTSPDPQWSDLGIRASGLLTWLHQLINDPATTQADVANLTAHTVSRHRFAALAGEDRAAIHFPDPAAGIEWRDLLDGVPQRPWPTDQAGLYKLVGAASAAHYAVNWPVDESDFTPIAADQVSELTGVADVSILAAERLSGARPTVARPWYGWLRPDVALALLLILVLLAETFFADRLPRAAS